jgi:hypothetical protein
MHEMPMPLFRCFPSADLTVQPLPTPTRHTKATRGNQSTKHASPCKRSRKAHPFMTTSDPMQKPSNLLRSTPSTPRQICTVQPLRGIGTTSKTGRRQTRYGKGTGTARRGDNGSRDSKRRCYSNAHETHDFVLVYPAPAVPICFGYAGDR